MSPFLFFFIETLVYIRSSDCVFLYWRELYLLENKTSRDRHKPLQGTGQVTKQDCVIALSPIATNLIR